MDPLDSSCQAEYADGYIHDETELDDTSQYGTGNVFSDIVERRPEADHGRMVRFSVFWRGQRYDIDWRDLPENAWPIRQRHGYSHLSQAGEVLGSGWSGVDFGFQLR